MVSERGLRGLDGYRINCDTGSCLVGIPINILLDYSIRICSERVVHASHGGHTPRGIFI